MIIRRATEDDIPEIYELLSSMHDGAVIPIAPMSEGKVLHMIKHMMEKGIILLAVKDGKIIGSQAGKFSSDWRS